MASNETSIAMREIASHRTIYTQLEKTRENYTVYRVYETNCQDIIAIVFDLQRSITAPNNSVSCFVLEPI